MDFKELSIILSIAWRNVWKNKRRTILTLLTIVVGCGMIIFMNAIATGGHEKMIEDAVATNAGHIQIHEKEFWENRSMDYAFNNYTSLLESLKDYEEIKGFSRRIHGGGLLSFENTTSSALIQGIEPEAEKSVSDIYLKIQKGGRYLNNLDTDSIIIGKVLAKNLGVTVGSTLALISQGFDGSIAAENLTVVGIFNTGNPEYDNFHLFMPFRQAQRTFTMMSYINSITIRLKNSGYTEKIKAAIKSRPDAKKLEVMGWDELMPELVQFIVMDDFSAYIFDFILFMVVAFGILNTIQMSVFERTRELGVMLAIGTRPEQVIRMVLFESSFITLLGIILGVSLGSAVSYHFTLNPIDYTEYADEMQIWGVSTVTFPAKITYFNLLVTSAFTFILSMIFSFFPARRASRLKPI
jgi:putative ABC transport system permease protein